ncbi:unnamed protein product [marine sediment metagenome]|uniref:Uncharacterized protein n=1 Tax=marine sediment metagenome TaxID=412755 RepID=X1E8H4_9ZZZZ
MKPYIDLTHLIEEGMPAWKGATSGDQGTHDTWERQLHPLVDPVNYLGKHLDSPLHFSGALSSESENSIWKKE